MFKAAQILRSSRQTRGPLKNPRPFSTQIPVFGIDLGSQSTRVVAFQNSSKKLTLMRNRDTGLHFWDSSLSSSHIKALVSSLHANTTPEERQKILETILPFFKTLKESMVSYIREPIEGKVVTPETDITPTACLTVPCEFSLEQRRLLISAAKEAGINLLHLVEDPIAALHGGNMIGTGGEWYFVADFKRGSNKEAFATLSLIHAKERKLFVVAQTQVNTLEDVVLSRLHPKRSFFFQKSKQPEETLLFSDAVALIQELEKNPEGSVSIANQTVNRAWLDQAKQSRLKVQDKQFFEKVDSFVNSCSFTQRPKPVFFGEWDLVQKYLNHSTTNKKSPSIDQVLKDKDLLNSPWLWDEYLINPTEFSRPYHDLELESYSESQNALDNSTVSDAVPAMGASFLAASQDEESLSEESILGLPIGFGMPQTSALQFFASLSASSRRDLPLPFPTTLSFPSVALNQTFPFIRSKTEINPSEPNFSTSFAMSENPFSHEEEYFVRLDLSALKLKHAQETRPKLNLHIVVDLAAPQQTTFIKEREQLLKITTWQGLEEFMSNPLFVSHMQHLRNLKEDLERKGDEQQILLDAKYYVLSSVIPPSRSVAEMVPAIEWIIGELEPTDQIAISLRGADAIETILQPALLQKDQKNIHHLLEKTIMEKNIVSEGKLTDFGSCFEHAKEAFTGTHQLDKEERRVLYLTNMNPLPKNTNTLSSLLHDAASSNTFVTVISLQDDRLQNPALSSYLNHIKGANCISFQGHNEDIYFHHRYSRLDGGHGRFLELLIPRFFNIYAKPISNQFEVVSTFDASCDSLHPTKPKEGVFLGTLCGHDYIKPGTQVCDFNPTWAKPPPGWLNSLSEVITDDIQKFHQKRKEVEIWMDSEGASLNEMASKPILAELSESFWEELTLEVKAKLLKMITPFRKIFEYHYIDIRTRKEIEKKQSLVARLHLGILKQKLHDLKNGPAPTPEAIQKMKAEAAQLPEIYPARDTIDALKAQIDATAQEILKVEAEIEAKIKEERDALEMEQDRLEEEADKLAEETWLQRAKEQTLTPEEEEVLAKEFQLEQQARELRKLERETRKKLRETPEPEPKTPESPDVVDLHDQLYRNLQATEKYRAKLEFNQLHQQFADEIKCELVDIPWKSEGPSDKYFYWKEKNWRLALFARNDVNMVLDEEMRPLKKSLLEILKFLEDPNTSRLPLSQIETKMNEPFLQTIQLYKKMKESWKEKIRSGYRPEFPGVEKKVVSFQKLEEERQTPIESYTSWVEERTGAVLFQLKKSHDFNDGVVFESDTPSKSKAVILEGETITDAIKNLKSNQFHYLLCSFEDRAGKQHFRQLPISLPFKTFSTQYDEPGVKKAVLLSRFSNLMQKILHNQFLKLWTQAGRSGPASLPAFSPEKKNLGPLTEAEQTDLFSFYNKEIPSKIDLWTTALSLSNSRGRFDLEPEWNAHIDTFLSYYQKEMNGEWSGLKKSYEFVASRPEDSKALPPLRNYDIPYLTVSKLFKPDQADFLEKQSNWRLTFDGFMKNLKEGMAKEKKVDESGILEKFRSEIADKEVRFEERRKALELEKKKRDEERKKAQQERIRKMREKQQASTE